MSLRNSLLWHRILDKSQIGASGHKGSVPELDELVGVRLECDSGGWVKLVEYIGKGASRPVLQMDMMVPAIVWLDMIRVAKGVGWEWGPGEPLESRPQPKTGPLSWGENVKWPERFSATLVDAYDRADGNKYLGKIAATEAYSCPGDYLTDAEANLHDLVKITLEERAEFCAHGDTIYKDLPLTTPLSVTWWPDVFELREAYEAMLKVSYNGMRDYGQCLKDLTEAANFDCLRTGQ